MTRLDYLLKQYENLLGWYRQSEEKARFLVTINTLVVGVANGLVFVGADKVGAVRSLYAFPVWGLLAGSGVALLASYVFILRALWPRHHAHGEPTAPSERIWFFGDVAAMTKQDFGAAIGEWTEARLETAMIAQNHILSRNVWVKHEALNRAIVCTIVALVLFFCLGVAYGVAVAHTPLPPAAA
ncbi:MAG: Pycsar system effector family protein [Pseudomonadota bacterium]